MIRRLLAILMVCCLCFGPSANAADLPSWTAKQKPHRVKTIAKPGKAAAKPKLLPTKPKKIAAVPDTAIPEMAPDDTQVEASREPEVRETASEIDMVWVLDPLVANADGAKLEDSASVEGNLIVVDPGTVSLPYMLIELSGHIIKTPQTTARLDVKVGNSQRSVSWKADDIQSGKFKVELKADLQGGKLPAYFPVSALAFVTKEGKQGAAMVSLSKIVVRVGKVKVATSQ